MGACPATTIRDGKTIACETDTKFNHIEHHACRSAGDGGCVAWTTPAELDEGYVTVHDTLSKKVGKQPDPKKTEWSQLRPFLPALELAAKALQYGAKKHNEKPGTEAWRTVEDAPTVYGDAAMRHTFEHLMGRKFDAGSKLPHLAHALANILIAMTAEGEILS